MAVEPMRACGFRKVGGLYLVSSDGGVPCDRLPFPLHVCPCCGGGVKQSRGYQWLAPEFFGQHLVEVHVIPDGPDKGRMQECEDPLVDPICHPSVKVMLMWIGEKFYTPGSFTEEAAKLGVSKRITAIPKGLKVGETWIVVAHPLALNPCPNCEGKPITVELGKEPETCERCSGKGKAPAIFHAFIPKRIELILKQSDATPERTEQEKKRGVTVVAVPDDDQDHVEGSVYSDLAKRKKAEAAVKKKVASLDKFPAVETTEEEG